VPPRLKTIRFALCEPLLGYSDTRPSAAESLRENSRAYDLLRKHTICFNRLLSIASFAHRQVVRHCPIVSESSASAGTFTYNRISDAQVSVSLTDSISGTSTAICTFLNSSNGNYVVSNARFPNASQNGSFIVAAGPAPDNVIAQIFDVTVTSGVKPFAPIGAYTLTTSLAGSTYEVKGIAGVDNSSGTYVYTRIQGSTAALSLTDSLAGPGIRAQVFFNSDNSGTFVIGDIPSSPYQTALFIMRPSLIAPSFSRPLESQSSSVGGTVQFIIGAHGSPPLKFQWYKSGIPIPDATTETLTIYNVGPADVAPYFVAVSNSVGTITSEVATFTLLEAPSILTQPLGATNGIGANIVLTVSASGFNPFFINGDSTISTSWVPPDQVTFWLTRNPTNPEHTASA
jgi:hypothetical protein